MGFKTIPVLAGCMMLLSGWVLAEDSPPLPIEQLTEFYHAMDGDNWHRNDGWLDPDVSVCDWYGITCVIDNPHVGGFTWVGEMRLRDNNLSGELTTELLEQLSHRHLAPVPSRILDLSGNAISGSLPMLPAGVPVVNLANNALTGTLPPVSNDAQSLLALSFLILSGNRFSGPIPSDWEQLELRRLDLSNNRLEGGLDAAVASISSEPYTHLNLAANRLSGSLPTQMADLNLSQLIVRDNLLEGSIDIAIKAMDRAEWPILDLSDNRFHGLIPETIQELDWFPILNRTWLAWLGSIDICWNDLTAASGSVKEFLEPRHIGGSFDPCMNRPRIPLDPTASGSWFDPARKGEGLVQMLMPNGQVLVYWFTFEPHVTVPSLRQHWAFAVSPTLETGFTTDQLYAPIGGKFGRGEPESLIHYWLEGWISVDRIETGLQHFQFDYIASRHSVIGLPDHNHHSVRHDQVRLTRLAGTTCDNHQPNQWISGAWYNPEANGEGFVVEVTEEGRAVVYWFTYQPDDSGHQAWMMGDGDFDGTTLVIDNLVQPTGGIFGIDFDPELIDRVPWGSLTMEFDNDLNGHMWFDSVFKDYGSGDYPIERLARPMLADCD